MLLKISYCHHTSSYPLINNVTRVTRHSASLLDNIYCNIPYIQNNTTPGILYCSISDHHGIFCVTDIPIACTNNELKTFTRRDISLGKISKFNRCLKEVKWDFIHMNDAQEGFTFFQELFSLFFNQICTKKTFNITYKNRLQWMTNNLRNQIQEKMHCISKVLKQTTLK